MSTLPPPHVLKGLRNPRRSLPQTDIAGLRKWLRTTDACVTITADAVFALAEEMIGNRKLYFAKALILAQFEEWKKRGGPLTDTELWVDFVDLVYSLFVPEPT